jgi:hypothetical protein
LKSSNGANPSSKTTDDSSNLEFAFEYLLSKNNFKWIRVVGEQAILMSTSLQAICDEIILKKEGKQIKSMRNRQRNVAQSIPFLTRDKSLINATTDERDEDRDEKFTARNELEENKLFEDITNDDL